MQKRIPKPFSLLLFFLLLCNCLSATPECPIVTGRFQLANGTTADASATGWYLDASQVASTGYFAVKSNRLHAQELGGEGVWYSRVFSTAGYASFQTAVKITSEGDLNSSEYVKVYYKINGGPEVLVDTRTGNFGTIDFISGTLSGNNVQLVVRIYNYNNGGSQTSKYYIEEYRVFKEKGPCALSAITVTAAAANGGILTCSNASVGLSATATGTGTTTWSWSGPNGYTSTAQNPTVTTAGTYTVVATNSTGTGSASVTVTENRSAPVITAAGGALGCGTCTTLSATSNVSGATYQWTGPNNFSSASQNPTVCTVGTYTVTVTNPANGCSAQQSVSVSANAISTIWLEDFTGLANGTTSDAGSTQWTSTSTGTTGTYSVQNNEFKVSYTGQQVSTWTSQDIDISSRTNVSFSVDLRSEVASVNDALETTDYIRVYYKLNGGAETLLYEDQAGIGNTTNTTASINVSSATLSGNSLQIIIRTSNSDPTERYFFDNIKVTGSNAGATANATGGQLNCINNTVMLQGSSAAAGASYTWSGPNGFTSTSQNPVVSLPGTYTLTVAEGGCTATATAAVTQDTVRPVVTAAHTGAITCINPSLVINGTAPANSTSYNWTGPNGFTATTLNATITKGGTYIFRATNPATGCVGTASTVVEENTVRPGEISINNSGIITCLTGSVTISGTSSSTGVSYRWEGPNGYSSSSTTATVTHGGLYTLTATNATNGCTSSKSTNVAENTTTPAVTIENNGPISCARPAVTLSAVTTTPNAGFLWLGPDFVDVAATTTTSGAGLYFVTVTDPANGCNTTAFTEVTEDYSDCGARKVTMAGTATGVNSFTFKAYPNPVQTTGVIEFTAPQNTPATVSLYNALGACEKVLFKGTATANRKYQVNIPAVQLKAGAYYYIINTGSQTYTGKLMIAK